MVTDIPNAFRPFVFMLMCIIPIVREFFYLALYFLKIVGYRSTISIFI